MELSVPHSHLCFRDLGKKGKGYNTDMHLVVSFFFNESKQKKTDF